MISRRDFLFESTSILAAAAVAPVPLRFLPRAAPARRVLVIGAGAAGLCAAYELDRAGHEVLVFEAKAIPGGRIHTLRAPFADGLWAEAGAMVLSEAHNLPLDYARAFKLPLAEMAAPRADLGSIAYVAGHRIEMRPSRPIQWPVPLKPEEAGQSLGALRSRYHSSQAAKIAGLGAADWPRAAHLEYDDLSLAEFWRKNGASDGAVQLMRLRYFDGYGEGVESVSALQLLREFGTFGPGKFYQIQGGNDLLPRAFAERLGQKIRYGSPVVAVRHDQTSVEISVEDRSGRQHVRGDYLICTLPFSVLRHITVMPAFSATRLRAIRQIQPTPSTRVFLQCRRRFWEAEGNDGTAVTDLPIQQIYHSTVAQPGTRGILESYTYGSRALRMAAMSPDDRLDRVLADATKVHPELPAYVEGGASYSWDNDPWALGGHAYLKPGQIREFFPQIQRPEGHIYFAGDLIGGIPGYVQGAMLSARTAADLISRQP